MATALSLIIGIKAYLLIQLAVIAVSGSAGVWLFYVQHQFEGVDWQRHGHWDYITAALEGSSFYKLPKVLQWFSGNIGFHHIHHLSPRIRSGNMWTVMGVAGCYVYAGYFFFSWFHTYLVKARGYSENDLLLSSLPFLVGACANCCGGLASNALVKKLGLKWGRRSIGLAGMGTAALSTVAVMFTQQWLGALVLLSLINGGITFQQPTMFAVCLDIGGEYAGAVVGTMNTAAQIGSFASSVAFGYLVGHFGSYDAPFVPMTAVLVMGAWLWLKVDPTQVLIPQTLSATIPAAIPLDLE